MPFSLRTLARRLSVAAVIAMPASLLVASAPAWAATDFTWSGGAPAGEPNWSNGSNWEGGVAPSGSIGALTFPTLTVGSCATTCYVSGNNIAGLIANSLTIGDTYYNLYDFRGDALSIGAEGMKVAEGARANIETMPLNLMAPQTWSLGEAADVSVGEVTGASEALTLALSGGSYLTSANIEAGPISVTGSGTLVLPPGADLNGIDRNPVELHQARLEPTFLHTITGPLTSRGGEIRLLVGETYTELAIEGGLTLDAASTVTVPFERYNQTESGALVTASGTVSLADAKLALPLATPYCPEGLEPGNIYTLITTPGSLTGTFAGIPNGTAIQVGNCPETLRINYSAHSVTATVTQGSPVGEAFTRRELAAGGHNPSEFCLVCFLGKLISFIQPVDAPTGNFWHTFDDISVPGRSPPLELTRTYNSMSASTDSPFGYGWSFPYDMSLSFPDATHVVVNQENGSQVTFTEQTGGMYRAPPRVTATLVHNEDGSWTFVRRHRDTFSFDSSGRLTQEQNINGYATDLAYNGSDQLTTVTDSAGRKLTFAYTGNHITSVTDPLGRVVKYSYDAAGDLTDVTDVNSGDTHFTYDSEHRMLTMRLPDQAPAVPGSTGAVLSNKYDGQGRVIEQTDQLGRTTKFAYSGEPLGEAGGSTTITDPKGNVTLQEYRYGELLSETRGYGTPQAATWTFGYDPATLGMTSITDPDGHTTTNTFDAEGNLLTSTDALGRTTTNTYNGLNDLLTSTDPMGVTTTNTYDAHGNLLSTERPLTGTSEAQKTTYTYGDPSHPGDVTAMTDPEGNNWKYTYDADGDRTSTTDPLGDKTTFTYNVDGWLLSTTSPRGNAAGANPASFTTTYALNNFGQVTETVDPLGHKTTNEYDPDQNLITSTDPNGNTTRYTYDAADEQTEIHRADGTTLKTTYWPDGTVKEQIDGAGNATKYEYDPLGREIAVTDPLGHTTSYGYDPAGNRTTVTDPQGRVTTTAYDAANEPTSTAYSDGKTPNVTGITYNADGERTGQSDGSGTWSWTWDSLHRLTSVVEGNNGTVKYQYDLRDDPTVMTYPNGKTVTREYDAAGRWTSVTDWLGNKTSFAYDPDGNLVAERLPAGSGIADDFTYAADDSMSAISDKRGAISLFEANYTRDGDRQLTGDSSQPESENGYGYTALNQLCYAGASGGSCASPRAGATQYQYDSADNLTRMGATTQTYNAGDELTSTSTPFAGGEKPEGNPPSGGGEQPAGPGSHGSASGASGSVLGVQGAWLAPQVTSGKVTFVHTGKRRARALAQTLSTKTADNLILAFLSAKKSHGGGHPSIKGGGLKWTRVTSANGPAEYVGIWQARATKPLKRTRITAELGRGGSAVLAVVGFDSGASVVGASKAAKKSRQPSAATVVSSSTAVWAIGQAAAHGKVQPLKGQTLRATVSAPGSARSWLQSDAPTAAGRVVVGGSIPKPSAWMLDSVTIKEQSTPTATTARLATSAFSAASTLGVGLSPHAQIPITSAWSGRTATRTTIRPQTTAAPADETVILSYDPEGDRIGSSNSGGTPQTYSYNQALELTGVGSNVSYSYNGDGLRMSKTVNSTTSSFTWDVAAKVPTVLEDGTNAYVYGPSGLPLEQITGSKALWFHHDQLGSTRALTNASGETVTTYSYTPYGSVSNYSRSATTPLLYSGQYHDSESNLYYLRARSYDPATGQFLTRDPIAATTRAPYHFASDDPTNATDASGLAPCASGVTSTNTCPPPPPSPTAQHVQLPQYIECQGASSSSATPNGSFTCTPGVVNAYDPGTVLVDTGGFQVVSPYAVATRAQYPYESCDWHEVTVTPPSGSILSAIIQEQWSQRVQDQAVQAKRIEAAFQTQEAVFGLIDALTSTFDG